MAVLVVGGIEPWPAASELFRDVRSDGLPRPRRRIPASISPLTALLTYGLVGADGRADVRLVYDHRVFDGATVARALVSMESVLNTVIREELLKARRNESGLILRVAA